MGGQRAVIVAGSKETILTIQMRKLSLNLRTHSSKHEMPIAVSGI